MASLRAFIKEYHSTEAGVRLFSDARNIHLFSCLGAAVLTLLLWGEVPGQWLLSWLATMTLFQCLLTLCARLYIRYGKIAHLRFWLRIYSVLSISTHLTWGSLTLMFEDYLGVWQQLFIQQLLFVVILGSRHLLSRIYSLFSANVVALALPSLIGLLYTEHIEWQSLLSGVILGSGALYILYVAKRDAEDFLAQLNRDPVTSLMTRRTFFRELQRSLVPGDSVLVCQVRNYTAICNTLGDSAGDAVLKHLSELLQDALPGNAIIGRLSDAEFGMLARFAPERIASRLLSHSSRNLQWNGHDILLDISLGTASDDGKYSDGKATVRRAQLAAASSDAHGSLVSYHPVLMQQAEREIRLRAGLAQARQNGELALHLQAKVDIKTGKVNGAEGLLRWHSPVFGEVSPVEFIPLAEKTGLIIEIGNWVIEQAADFLMHLPGSDYFSLAINVSVVQFAEENFVDEFRKRMPTLPPGRHLELEITESVVMLDTTVVRKKLAELSKMGIHIALDDFGTGYSSLSYLAELDIDTLKIDRSFINNILSDEKAARLVKTMIDMAKGMGLTVVAEGIETVNQLDKLNGWHCDSAQGYYIAKPIPAMAFYCQYSGYPKTAGAAR